MKRLVLRSKGLYNWLIAHEGDDHAINLEHSLHCALYEGALKTNLDVPKLGVQRLDHIEVDTARRRVVFHDRCVDAGGVMRDNSYVIAG